LRVVVSGSRLKVFIFKGMNGEIKLLNSQKREDMALGNPGKVQQVRLASREGTAKHIKHRHSIMAL
jgi:hypothetical protein